jgi:hypothetical protein
LYREGLLVPRRDDSRLTDETAFPKIECSGISEDTGRLLTGKEYKAKAALFSGLDGSVT